MNITNAPTAFTIVWKMVQFVVHFDQSKPNWLAAIDTIKTKAPSTLAPVKTREVHLTCFSYICDHSSADFQMSLVWVSVGIGAASTRESLRGAILFSLHRNEMITTEGKKKANF